MNAFDYIACGTVADALRALDAPGGGRVLAGGTDLLIELRRSGKQARRIVDIGGVAELRGVMIREGEVHVGSLTTHAELAGSVLRDTPARFLCAAAGAVGSPQIRNRGTIGGNIMNAAACADTVPPLCALNARLTLVSAKGTRELPMSGFFKEPYRTYAHENELLTRISFPLPSSGGRGAFIKLGRRNAVSISRLSVAAMVIVDGAGVITVARIVPGAALPVWQNIGEAASLLIGAKPVQGLFVAAGAKAAEVMVRQTGRRWSTEYKEPVLAALVRRALESCCAQAVDTTEHRP
jgi:CO/xanthine dehydrogenase FAD-binding subunit